MKVSTLLWTQQTGWGNPSFPCENPEWIVYFASPSLMKGELSPISDLVAKYPHSVICGCSTAGEIMGKNIHDESIVAAMVQFDSTKVKAVAQPINGLGESAAVGRAAATALASPDLQHVLILSEGLSVNGTALMDGFREVLPQNISITGGLAGDGAQFQETFVGLGDALKKDQLVAVGFYGEKLVISYSSRGGWEPFGPRRHITRSEGNTLFELDDQPALDLYKRYLGERANELPASGLLFPLELSSHTEAASGLVRTILAVDEEAKSLTFAGDIPQGGFARLMKASTEQLVDGAASAGEAAAKDHPASKLAILVSCVGRRLVLGQRVEEELESVIEILPKDTQAIGFYSYGEVCPGDKGSPTELHNQTMTITLWSEQI